MPPSINASIINTALDRLQQELDWLRKNTRPIDGEHAAVRESWTNAFLDITRIDVHTKMLDAARIEAEKKLRGVQHSLDEALNSGSGVYKP